MDKKHKGAALPTVIIIMVIVIILGMVLLNVALADTKFAMRQQFQTQTHYVARSGVLVGVEIIGKEIVNYGQSTLTDFVAALNTHVASYLSANPNAFTVDGKGKFELNYELYGPSEIKIFSTATSLENNTVTESLSLRVKMKLPDSPLVNPADWVTGINLQKGINANTTNYLGQAVEFEGNPVQSPKGGTSDSVFRASILYFTDAKGISLRQINNTINITFDASIVYFVNTVKLNATGDDIKLGYSLEVAADKKTSGSIMYLDDTKLNNDDSYESTHGYESADYYNALIQGFGTSMHSSYSFQAGKRYGVVYFGGGILDSSANALTLPNNAGQNEYFFYPDGVDITEASGRSQLIPIAADDPIIDVLINRFSLSVNSQSYLWGRE